MPKQNRQPDREQAIYQVEDQLPVGSIDKIRSGAGGQDEQYPVPPARPLPWQED